MDVPLSDVPQTGDNSSIWYVLAVLSVSGLAVLALVEKRKDQEG
ncbi:MAG: LPXTG cell wall anchor domain-containing protein [Oscillospiraceae bacterium]|nr:LPXTG cell wall anchor domain-containing protein [Oscillospiraceae bacterium]